MKKMITILIWAFVFVLLASSVFGSLTDDLVSYWKLEDNATNTIVEDSHGNNNGTASINTTNLSISGKINNGLDFDDSNNEYVNFGDLAIDYSNPWCMAAWVYLDAKDAGDQFCISLDDVGSTELVSVGLDHSENAMKIFSDGKTPGDDGTAVAEDTWYHIVLVWNGTDFILYRDGSEAYSVTPSDAGAFLAGIDSVKIAWSDEGIAGVYWDGIIDEVAFWSREITSTEVEEIYASGNGKSYDDFDTTAPTVNIINSSFSTTDTQPYIYFNSSENADCTLYNGSTGYGNNASVIADTETSIQFNTTLTVGTNYTDVYVNCTDDASNEGNSTSIWVNIIADDTAPAITLNYPTDTLSLTTGSAIDFNCSVADADSGITNVSLYGNWSGGWHNNETNSTGTDDADYIFDVFPAQGTYIYNCYACDNASTPNCGFAAANYTFTITYPTFTGFSIWRYAIEWILLHW